MCRGLGQRGREVEVKVNRHFLFTFYILKTQGTGSVIKNAIGRLYRHRKKADDDKVSVGSGKCFGAVASKTDSERPGQDFQDLPLLCVSHCLQSRWQLVTEGLELELRGDLSVQTEI